MVTLESLQATVKALPQQLHSCLRSWQNDPQIDNAVASLSTARVIDLVGLGGSFTPLAVFFEAKNARGVRQVHAGGFLREPRAEEDSALLMFSQSLSPNACLCWNRAKNYSSQFLVSGEDVELSKLGSLPDFHLEHPPSSEAAGLLRMAGPS
ncbi:MAG: hypothetical protein MK135_14290, partial [Polyangiaceae bacterium]|nr:hypothetical protein [Polyangiaceae bacterium]